MYTNKPDSGTLKKSSLASSTSCFFEKSQPGNPDVYLDLHPGTVKALKPTEIVNRNMATVALFPA